MTWYFTNASTDNTWETLTNWNDAIDGTGANPTSAPWVSDYLGDDLAYATGVTSDASLNSSLASNVTGSCGIDVTNNGYVYSGTFTGSVSNNSYIFGGTFTGSVSNNSYIFGGTFTGSVDNYGSIISGTFTASVSNNSSIFGGTFTGSVSNNSNINGGTFIGSVDNYNYIYGGYFSQSQATIGGTINGGIFDVVNFLYFTNNNGSGDSTWETLTNWNTTVDGSGSSASDIPWTDSSIYLGYCLVYGTGGYGTSVSLNSQLASNVTGSCGLDVTVGGSGNIYGGTFTGSVDNSNSIYGGTFTGSVSNNSNINGGTFTGYVDSNGYINGGTFIGSVDNYNYIYGGYFSQSQATIGGTINGGTFDVTNFLYFTNNGGGGDGTWENTSNWNTAVDGSGSSASDIPWTDSSIYLGYCLVYGTGGYGTSVSLNSQLASNVTGSCGLNVTNYGSINGGTFTGSVDNYGSIISGTFTGSIYNAHYIFGGTFTGSVDNSNSIYGGTFTGYVGNGNSIYGGTFTASVSNNSSIFGGTFTGSVDSNGYINGGTFIGSVDNYNYIYGGYFSQSQATIGGTINGGIFDVVNFLYFTNNNGSGDSTWENTSNWNTTVDGSGSNPTSVPWVSDHLNYCLVYGTGGYGTSVSLNSQLASNVTGSCGLDVTVGGSGNIYGGTFTGYVGNSNSIYGGTFTGYVGNSNSIYGGTFTGSVTNNSNINGGTFTGSVDNSNSIYGGTFTGSVSNNSNINGGTFTGYVDSNGYINGGYYLSKGTIKHIDISGNVINLKGVNANPYPQNFISLQASDIIGSGML